MTEEPPYDLFISYADADRAWVEGYLVDALTTAAVSHHCEAAFALGVPRLLEFERAIRSSRRTLLVLSPAYVADGFAQFTDLLAQSYGLETATWPIIPLVLHPVALPPRLAMLSALDATSAQHWSKVVERLCATVQRPMPGPPTKPACPYPGMVPFREGDSDHFYGREREVQEMLERLRLHPFLAVIGPSGSGKSSLVFAGLLPALHRSGLFGTGDWLVRTFRPGETPLAAFAATLGGTGDDLPRAVSDLLTAHAASRLLLVVDQFEEVWTLGQHEALPFQANVLGLARTPNCSVMLTVRADFYADLMAAPIWHMAQAHRYEVLPLGDAGLRAAIVRPAEDVGVFVEAALVERLVADAAGEPGVLPLVQETLVLLWERLERRFLPLSAYQALVLSRGAYGALGGPAYSGLQVAMARRADAAIAELPAHHQATARRIFLRLIQFGEGRADTRRQQTERALQSASDDARQFAETLSHLINHRLLTSSGAERGASPTVDLAHEALIGGWPTLQTWVAERREAEQTRRRLEAKAAEWARLGRSNGGLLDEVELLEAERWLATPDAVDLGYDETLPLLVQASRADQAARVAQQRRGARFRRATLSAIMLLTMLVLGIGWWSTQRNADNQRQRLAEQQSAKETAEALASAERRTRATAEAERDRAQRQERYALAGKLAVHAQALLATNPQRSLLLAAEAVQVSHRAGDTRLPAAEEMLRQALAASGGRGLVGHTETVDQITISPDSRWLVTASSTGVARLWDLAAADPMATGKLLPGRSTEWLSPVTISPDSHWLAIAGSDHTALLWNLTRADPAAAPIALPGHVSEITTMVFSPDSRWLATGSLDTTARLWNLAAPDPAATVQVLTGHTADISAISISADNHWLVTAGGDSVARLWDLTAADPAATSIELRGHEAPVTSLAFSGDHHWLATGDNGGTVRLWDITVPDPGAAARVVSRSEDPIRSVEFSPNSRWLLTLDDPPLYYGGDPFPGGTKTTARLWNVTNITAPPIELAGHEGTTTAAVFSPDNHWLVTASGDTTARLWDLTATDPGAMPMVLRGHTDWIYTVDVSADSHWLVTGSADNTARLWDLTAADPATTGHVLRGHSEPIVTVRISPDSRWLVTGSDDTTARLWDLTAPDPAAPTSPTVLRAHHDAVTSLALSPDNRWLLTGSRDNTARLWDVTAREVAAQSVALRGHVGTVAAAAFSGNSRWLSTKAVVTEVESDAIASQLDPTVRLWDLTVANPGATPLEMHDVTSDMAMSPDSHWLAAGGLDHTLLVWDLTAANPAVTPVVLHGHADAISSLAFSSDSRWLATGDSAGQVRLWEVTAAGPTPTMKVLRRHEEAVMGMAFSSDQHWLVTSDNTGNLWLRDLTAADGAQVAMLRDDTSTVVLSNNGRWLATATSDNTPWLWDLTAADPATPITLPSHEQFIVTLTISPDSRWLLTGDTDGNVRLWDLTAADPKAAPIVLRGHDSGLTAAAFSADGQWLATASSDPTVRLWDLSAADSSTTPVVLHSHEQAVTAVAFSSDSQWLVTSSDDHTVRLWALRLDEVLAASCRTVGRNLTPEEWDQFIGSAIRYQRTCPNLPPGTSTIPPTTP